MIRWVLLASVGVVALIGPAAVAEAQSVTVQGQVEYQPYGQPPAGYGQPYQQPYQQPYVQPYQQQPQYVQPYQQPYAPTRQLRYVDRESSIKGLWIPGIIIFGVSWALTGSFATMSGSSDYMGFGWIPLVGPWLMLGEARGEDERTGALVGGIAQVAGLTMFVLGLSLRHTVRVAVYSLDETNERAPQLAFDLLPAPGGARVGLTLSHF